MFLGIIVAVSVLVISITFIATKNNIQKVAASRFSKNTNCNIQSMDKLPVSQMNKEQNTVQVISKKDKTRKRENGISR